MLKAACVALVLILGAAMPAGGFRNPSLPVPQSLAHCRPDAVSGGCARRPPRVCFAMQVGLPVRMGQGKEYDAAAIGDHFRKHPWEVAGRLWQLSRSFGSAGAAAVVAVLQGQRGSALVDTCGAAAAAALAEAGPTYSKFGQALSCRPDLIGDGLAAALQELQDRVPPFDDAKARHIVREELGMAGKDLLESMGEEPVAAATLGQVYRAQVNGKSVALKVQRPHVMEAVAADSFIIRSIASALEMLRSPISGDRLIKPYLVAGWCVSISWKAMPRLML